MKNNQDNLEHLFGRRFNEEEAINQKEGWNVPSEDVWNRIQIGLAKEEKVKRRVLYWPLVAVAASFLLLSIFPLYHSKQKIDSLAAKLEANEQVLKSMQKELSYVAANNPIKQHIALKEKEVLHTEQTILKETIAIDREKMPASSNQIAISKQRNSSDKKLTNSYVIAPSLSGIPLDKEVANFETPIIETDAKTPLSATVAIVDAPNTKTTNHYPTLSNLPILEKALAIPPSEKVVVAKPLIAPSKNKKVYIAASIAPAWETLNKKSKANQVANFEPKTVQQKSAFSAGIHAGVNVGKGWAIETGLRYTNTNDAVKDTRAITYEQVGEHLNNLGEYESNLNIQMGSSAGLTETVVVLSRSAISTVEEGTTIDLNFAFTNSQSYIDIPVLARKQWRVGNLGVGITAGLLNRFLLEKNFDLPTVTLEDNRFIAQSRHISKKKGTKDVTGYRPHYLVGLDFEYAIYPDLYVFITPTISNSIRPIIEGDSSDIYAQEKMLNMGVRYQL